MRYRYLYHGINGFWWVLLSLLVVLIAYVVAGRYLSSQIQFYKKDVEQWVSDQTGLLVSLEQFKGGWNLFSPVVHIRGVSVELPLSDALLKNPLDLDTEVLSIASIEAELDVGATILNQVPVFGGLRVSGVVTDIEQGENNAWALAGLSDLIAFPQLDNAAKATQPPAHLDWHKTLKFIDSLIYITLLQEEIQVLGVHLRFKNKDKEAHTLTLNQLKLQKFRQSSLVEGSFVVDGQKSQSGRWVLAAKGSPLKDDFKAQGYLSINQSDWTPLIPLFADNDIIKTARLGAGVWFTIEDNSVQNVYFDLDVDQFDWQLRFPHQVKNAKYAFSTERADGAWLLHSRETQINLDGRIWHLPNLDAKIYQGFSQIDVQLQNLDLAAFIKSVRQGFGWPATIEAYLKDLNPRGLLDYVLMSVYLDNAEFKDFQLSAKLQHINLDPWSGAPGVSNAAASIRMTLAGGEVLFYGNQSTLYFPDLYSSSWLMDTVEGRVRYRVMEDYVTVWGDHLAIKHPLINKIKAFFDLYLSANDKQSPSTFTLGLDFQQVADVQAQKAFVPNVLGPGLRHWLNTALLKGQIDSGQVFYHGSIVKDDSDSQVEVLLKTRDLSLAYLPDWPAVHELTASVWIQNEKVVATVEKGVSLGGRIQQAQVYLPGEKAGVLDVNLDIAGSAKEAFSYLTNTPLNKVLSGPFHEWAVTGVHNSRVALQVPILVEGDVKIDLNTDLTQSSLALTQQDLTFTDINGRVSYSTKDGLSSKQLTAQLFNELFTFTIQSDPMLNHLLTDIAFRGHIQLADVKEWADLALLSPFEGRFPVTGVFSIDDRPHRYNRLLVKSDLLGLTSACPAPFTKAPDVPTAFDLKLLLKESKELFIRYGEELQLAFVIGHLGVERGQVFLGKSQAYIPTEPGLEILGHVSYLSASDWIDFLASGFSEQTSSKASSSPSVPKNLSIIRHVDVSLEKLQYNDWVFNSFRIRSQPDEMGWNVAVESPLIRGTGHLSNRQRRPHRLRLDYIHWPIIEPHDGLSTKSLDLAGPSLQTTPRSLQQILAQDPLRGFDVKTVPAFDLSVQEIFLGPENYGRWDIEVRHESDRLRFDIKDAFIKKARLIGRVFWYGGNTPQTEIPTLRIETQDFGDLQRAWRTASAVEAKDSKAELNFQWQGSPLAFNKESLQGAVNFQLSKVRTQVEGNAANNAKLFGIVNLGALGRRFQGDFSDIVDPGLEFGRIYGKLSVEDQWVKTLGTIKAEGTLLKGEMSGRLDLQNLHIDAELLGTLSLTSQLPLFAVLIGLAPPVAVSLFVTEQLTGGQLERLASFVYKVKGPVADPSITLNRVFDNRIQGKQEPWYQQLLRSNSSNGKIQSTQQEHNNKKTLPGGR